MSQASKGKRTFWLTDSPYEEHKSRAALLSNLGYDVSFLRSMREVIDSLNEIRPTCVLIDCNANNQQSIGKSIEKLNQLPELSGTKFILSLLGQAPDAAKAAASENFRDLIPFDLSQERWLQRFKHATSVKPIDLVRPLCEISMNQLAMAYAPARVVWISETHIRIECRGGQSIGSTLQISGPISKDLGVPFLSLVVESVHRNELMYRFSQALVCRWRVPESHSESAKIAVRRMINAHPAQAARFRAFAAISNPDIRRSISKDLNRNQFEVKLALLRSTIAQELAFFSPDIIFFDHKIISSLEELDLQMIASKLDPAVQLVVLGETIEQHNIKRIFSKQNIHFETDYDQNKTVEAVSTYKLQTQAKPIKSEDRRIHILSDQTWSRVELQMPARLTSLNPSVGQVSLPFSVSAFAAIRLEAPILRKSLGRAPYIRVMRNTDAASKTSASQFAHHATFYFADTTPKEEALLSEVLLSMVGNYYKKQFIDASLQQEMLGITHGSIKQAAGFPSGAEATGQIVDQTIKNDGADQSTDAARTSSEMSVKKPRAAHKSAHYAPSFNIRDYIDPVIIKAVVVFAIAMTFVLGLLSLASRIDPSFYKDHGRQYSDFFLRMSDPAYRQKNPVPQSPESNQDK